MPKTRDIKSHTPGTVAPTAAKRVTNKDKEAAVVALQQEGELTIREAAMDLELTYEQYLDLLAQKGLSISPVDDTDPAVLESIRAGMRSHITSTK